MKKWSVILKQLSFYVVHLLTGQKYVFSAMCWATRGSEADRDMMSSRASRACWPTNPCLRDRDNTGYEFCAVLKYIHYLCVTCVHLCYPFLSSRVYAPVCVCVPTCVYTGWAGRREGSWQLPGPRWCGRTVRALRDPWPEPRRAGSAGELAPPPPRRRCLQGAAGD